MNKLILSATILFVSTLSYSQDFLDGNFSFSKKKLSYLTLKDGTEVTGYIDDIDRKKGLIEEITIKDEAGKEIEFLPDQINYMYIAPSGWDKFSQGYSDAFDLTKLEEDKSINKEYIKQGYALFETSEVMIKKDKKTLLLQLLNPGYNSKIRVYFDPYAKETASAGIGGFKIAGGDAKSYYVKKGTEVAFKLEKKNYEEEYEHLYGDCKGYKTKLIVEEKWRWIDFSKHVYKYTYECK